MQQLSTDVERQRKRWGWVISMCSCSRAHAYSWDLSWGYVGMQGLGFCCLLMCLECLLLLFQESKNSLRQPRCQLTRDVAVSRVVLSCMQTLASTPSSSSTPDLGVNRRLADNKIATPTSQCTRFGDYVKVSLCSLLRVTSECVQKFS